MTKMIEVTNKDPVVRTFMLFMQIAQAAYKYSDRHFYYSDRMTTATFVALEALVRSGGTMTHSELAERTNTVKHNITTLVDRMKRDGLVTSEYSSEDRRIANVQITKKGQRAFDRAIHASREIMETTMCGVGDGEAAKLENLLKIMKRDLERKSIGKE